MWPGPTALPNGKATMWLGHLTQTGPAADCREDTQTAADAGAYPVLVWPTPVYRPGERSGWAALDRRGRALALLGLAGLALATVATVWLSAPFGQPSTPVYRSAASAPAALWTWDGAGYSVSRVAGGPSRNDADMA